MLMVLQRKNRKFICFFEECFSQKAARFGTLFLATNFGPAAR